MCLVGKLVSLIAVLRSASGLLAAFALSQSAAGATLTVSNRNDSGSGSLRQALIIANNSLTGDTIDFNIAGEGPHRIVVQSNLPTISAPLTIDGYSQPGALVNTREDSSNAVIMLQLEGAPGLPGNGVGLSVCSSNVSIRGLAISGFSAFAVAVGSDSGGSLCAGSQNNVAIDGNFINLRADGVSPTAVTGTGVFVSNSVARIGGSGNAERNVISSGAVSDSAIFLINAVSGTSVDGNLIGADPGGVLNRGDGAGIVLAVGAAGVSLGSNRGNLVAFNSDGVRLRPEVGNGIRIGNNRFLGNLQAIDLGDDGLTPNDANDGDSGPNGLQNFPVITAATRTATGISIAGTLDRPAGGAALLYLIEVYASSACSASGFGGGERRLGGNLVVLANGSSESFSFNLTLDEPLLLGTAITATATDAGNSTSELSACAALTEGAGALVVSNVNDSGAGSLRSAITAANANIDPSVVSFDIPGAGPHLLQVASNLPTLTAPLLIDGYTQPGAAVNTLDDASNALLRIQLDAAPGLSAGAGLSICGSDVTVTGLAIGNFSSAAIRVGLNAAGVPCATPISGVLIAGNFLGLTAAGALRATEFSVQLNVLDAQLEIGGGANALRNVIAHGSVAGNAVQFIGNVAGSRVDGNLIGSDPSGLLPRGIGGGINLGNSASAIAIGKRRPNLLGFGSAGLSSISSAGTAIDFGANAFVSNNGLGIDLNNDGVSANDPDDADSGPNHLQNFPELLLVQQRSGGLRILGHLDVPQSANVERYAIAIYESVACDGSGNGEGTIYRGSQDVALIDRSAGSDVEDFALNLAGVVAIGRVVTATATAPDGSSSELSRCIAVVGSDQLLRNGFE